MVNNKKKNSPLLTNGKQSQNESGCVHWEFQQPWDPIAEWQAGCLGLQSRAADLLGTRFLVTRLVLLPTALVRRDLLQACQCGSLPAFTSVGCQLLQIIYNLSLALKKLLIAHGTYEHLGAFHFLINTSEKCRNCQKMSCFFSSLP